MPTIRPTPLAALSLCALASCASVPGAARDVTTYTADLGTVAFESLTRGMEEVLVARHGYVLDQREAQYGSVYFATEWSEVGPGERSAAEGITAARERIVLRGRRSDGYYRVSFHGERRIRTEARPGWHGAPISTVFERRMDQIVAELEAAIRSDDPVARAPGTEPGGRR